MTTATRWLLILGLVLGLAGCGKDAEVGAGVDTEVGDAPAGEPRLGERLVTTTLPPITSAPQGGQLARANTTAPPTTKAAKSAAAPATTTVEIGIYGDDSGHTAFEPSPARAYVGTVIKWVNHDRVTRTIKEDDGRWASDPIPAGGSWSYKVTQPGTFNYHDDQRQYAVGVLEVLAR